MKLDLTNFPPLLERLMELAPLSLAAQLRHTWVDFGFKAKVARFLADNPECLPCPLEQMRWSDRLVRLHSIIAVAGGDPAVKAAAEAQRAMDVITADPAAFEAYLNEKLEDARAAMEAIGALDGNTGGEDAARLQELLAGVERTLGGKYEVVG